MTSPLRPKLVRSPIERPLCPECGVEAISFESSLFHPTFIEPCRHFIADAFRIGIDDGPLVWMITRADEWTPGRAYSPHEWPERRL